MKADTATPHDMADTPVPEISLIIPVFNEAEVVLLLYARLCQVASQLDVTWEWLFVNDGSSDNTGALLSGLAEQDRRVKILTFSRNFGHQIAITAGVDLAQGNAVVIIDADLQDPPELILDMYALYQRGYDVVYARRKLRHGENWLKLLTARGFYWFMKHFVYHGLPENVGDFRLMSRAVVHTMRYFPEQHRFYRGLVAWSGFKQTAIEFDRLGRAAGQTKYSLLKMMRFALDATVSFSYKPLRIAPWLGLFIVLAALFYGGHRLWSAHPPGSIEIYLILSLAMLQGMTLIAIGLLGEYIGRISENVKHRPLYIIQEITNLNHPVGQLPTGGVIAPQRAKKPGS